MKSVKSFELAPEGDEILIVATDGRLYVADSSGSVTESAQNVAEVSIAQSSHDGMSETVISIVRTDGVLLRYTAKTARSQKSAPGFYLLYSIMSSIPHPSAVHILSSTSLSYRLTRFL